MRITCPQQGPTQGVHPMRLAYKVAIITGSAGGMGKLAAEVFAREGASIVVTDIAAKEGEETARAIREAGGKAIFVKSNVTNEDEVKHMVNAAIDAFGRVDILYNNAGRSEERRVGKECRSRWSP